MIKTVKLPLVFKYILYSWCLGMFQNWVFRTWCKSFQLYVVKVPLTYVMVYILNQKRNFTFSLTVWRGSWLFDTIQWFVCSINDLAKFWFQYSKGTNQKSQIQQQSLRAAHGFACCFFSGQQFYFGTGRYIYFGTGRYQKCRVKNPDSVNQHLSNLTI